MSLKVDCAKSAMLNFETIKCLKNWDAMVKAVMFATKSSRKVAEKKLAKKYGNMFTGGVK
jgi:hypothetical protein